MPSLDNYRISTVVTPSASQGLVTLSLAKDELHIPATDTSIDGILGRHIAQVSSAINNYCGRIFVRQTYRDQWRLPYGCLDLGRPLTTWQRPIILASGVTTLSVIIDGAAATEIEVNNALGEVYRLNANNGLAEWAGSVIIFNYQAGYAAIPDDVQAAALEWLTARWSSRGRDPMLRSQNIPDVVAETYWVDPAAQSAGVPSEVEDLLRPYRPIAV